jgi:hypothetical protein
LPRLADHLAKRRLLYPSPLVSAPSVLVIDIPADSRGPGLALDRYYAVILENEAEQAKLERFLCAWRPALVAPDIFDHPPSALQTDTVLISRYVPPIQGWPWVSVCRWPESFTEAARGLNMGMARGCYTMELFHTSEALDHHVLVLLDALDKEHAISVRTLSAGMMPTSGNA